MGYIYLATPYSRFAGGIEQAFNEACRAAAYFVRRGESVFSPIAHTHPIAVKSGIDPLDLKIWLPQDGPLMNAAGELVIVKMPGWQESKGIAAEIEAFSLAGKPIRYLEWPVL